MENDMYRSRQLPHRHYQRAALNPLFRLPADQLVGQERTFAMHRPRNIAEQEPIA